MARDSLQKSVAIPYDFDYSGLASAPFALPAEHLEIQLVRQRHYNGYHRKPEEIEGNLLIFRKKKELICSLPHLVEGLERKYIDETIKYFDQFYQILDNTKRIQHEHIEKCRKD